MTEIKIPLDLPDVEVIGMETTEEGDYLISVKSTKGGTNCRRCGRAIDQFHGHDKPIVLRHLPVFGRRVYIRIWPVRYRCPSCSGNPTTTQQLSWYRARSPHTKAYEEHILLCLINSTVEDVSIKESLGYEAVMGIIDKHIAKEVDWEKFQRLERLGLDEIALKKGHKHYVTIVTTRVGQRTVLLGVLKDRKKETVEAFLRVIPKRLRDTLASVCCDMYDGFVSAVKNVLGEDIKIVIDRFHVAKSYREGIDNLRKQELKRLKKELPQQDYKKLKGAMWALRKAKDELTEEELRVLACLFIFSPSLKLAYQFSNELTDIFNQNHTKKEAIRTIEDWKQRVQMSHLTCFDRFLSTLDNWMDEITNYFENRLNSGFIEGLNNKIKVIKRRCYGILNIKHLFQRIYLDLEGYALFA